MPTGRILLSFGLMIGLVSGLLSARPAMALAIADQADIGVNFTDFQITTSGGDDASDTVTVDPSAAFAVITADEVGNASAEVDGDAQACNLADCGIISIFPLSVTASATAGLAAPSFGEAAGRALGELTFANTSDEDLTIRFFLESDITFDQLKIDDPASERAEMSWLLQFKYDDAVTEVFSQLFTATTEDVSIDDFCGAFPDPECSVREEFELSLPTGATRTLRGVALVTSLAEVNAIPEPPTLSILAPSLLGLLFMRRCFGRRERSTATIDGIAFARPADGRAAICCRPESGDHASRAQPRAAFFYRRSPSGFFFTLKRFFFAPFVH